MSDISPRRRSIGRWTFALGAALALPLTATVVYAGADAPEAPTAPTPPTPPTAPIAPRIEKHIEIITEHAGHEGTGDKMFEKRVVKDGKTIVIRSDKPIDEAEFDAHLARLDAMVDDGTIAPVPPVPPVPPAPGVAPAAPGEHREVRRIVMHGGDGHEGDDHEGRAVAMAFEGCKGGPTWADADFSRNLDEGGKKSVNRTRVVMCGKAGEAKSAALAGVRKARASIAANRGLGDEVRAEVLRELDHTIADMEQDAG